MLRNLIDLAACLAILGFLGTLLVDFFTHPLLGICR